MCNDGNPCTLDDVCAADGSCAGDPAAASGDDCWGEDRCAEVGRCDGAGECVFDEALSVKCDDDTTCVEYRCQPSTGTCVPSPFTGADCEDGDSCTDRDRCTIEGECLGDPIECDDGVPCTVDSCDPSSGCTFVPDADVCDDGNTCTEDTCHPENGCIRVPAEGGCDDGDQCTVSDRCDGGVCVGTPDPLACPCDEDSDCAGAAAGDLCAGTWSCVDSACRHDAWSEVRCPPDGAECKVNWSCDPQTGTCSGEDMSCDDGIPCTVDSCRPSRGCVHEPIDLCPLGTFCEVSGSSGDTYDCPVRLARGAPDNKPATGADLRLAWQSGDLALDNLVDEFCVGACFPINLVSCMQAGERACSVFKLQPTGHEVLLVPRDRVDWEDWISLTMVHSSALDAPLSEVVAPPGGPPPQESEVVIVRFKLLRDIPASAPAVVDIASIHFDRIDGGLDLEIRTTEGGTLFVTGGAR